MRYWDCEYAEVEGFYRASVVEMVRIPVMGEFRLVFSSLILFIVELLFLVLSHITSTTEVAPSLYCVPYVRTLLGGIFRDILPRGSWFFISFVTSMLPG